MSIVDSKFCVFCGEKPQGKTKEHIIPQWLIKLTGDPKRIISLGFDTKSFVDKGESKMRQYAFSAFHFPACESCNNEFSLLESQAKIIIEKTLSKDYLSAQEIDILLDWFDKVRIGLWLGMLVLDKDMPYVEPKFFIKNRIAEKDRCLFVYESDTDWKGIVFIGTNYPIFMSCPSCFALQLNNLFFVNISSDFLFSRNIGFPYPMKVIMNNDNEGSEMIMNPGRNKIQLPLIKINYLLPSIEFYQPNVPSKLVLDYGRAFTQHYDNEYVKKNNFDIKKGKGSVYYLENNKLHILDANSEICISNGKTYNSKLLYPQICKQIVDMQLHTIKLPSMDALDPAERKRIRLYYSTIFELQKKLRTFIKKL